MKQQVMVLAIVIILFLVSVGINIHTIHKNRNIINSISEGGGREMGEVYKNVYFAGEEIPDLEIYHNGEKVLIVRGTKGEGKVSFEGSGKIFVGQTQNSETKSGVKR